MRELGGGAEDAIRGGGALRGVGGGGGRKGARDFVLFGSVGERQREGDRARIWKVHRVFILLQVES